MDRLLSPNEAKFWLLDRTSPMNTVAVIQSRRRLNATALAASSDFAIPTITIGRNQRPRWSSDPDQQTAGRVEELVVADSSPDGWLPLARRLLNEPVGVAGQPGWRAIILQHGADGPVCSTLLFAVNHALADWRGSLALADAWIAGRHPGDLDPPIEEQLPSDAFANSAAADLIDGWYGSALASRWDKIGNDRLAAVMPRPVPATLSWARLTANETADLRARCRDEGASMNAALAVALAEQARVAAIDLKVADFKTADLKVALAVDLSRRVPGADLGNSQPPAPGLTVSHVYVDVQPAATGGFWAAARQTRSRVAEQAASGFAGDALLILPRVLLRDELTEIGVTSGFSITSPPADVWSTTHPDDQVMRFGLGPARAGGVVVHRSDFGDQLQIIVNRPDDAAQGADLAAADLVARLRAAITA